MIDCFLSNISAKYYKNLSMLSRVIAKNVRDVFFETQCSKSVLQLSDVGLSLLQLSCVIKIDNAKLE